MQVYSKEPANIPTTEEEQEIIGALPVALVCEKKNFESASFTCLENEKTDQHLFNADYLHSRW